LADSSCPVGSPGVSPGGTGQARGGNKDENDDKDSTSQQPSQTMRAAPGYGVAGARFAIFHVGKDPAGGSLVRCAGAVPRDQTWTVRSFDIQVQSRS
jgi:hypothetical protein